MVVEGRPSMTRILLLAGIVWTSLFSGCVTIPENEARLDSFIVCDADFVARIEREARRHGTAIRWMRCPQLVPAFPPVYFGDWRNA
jgi:hypothetical protein